MLPNEPPKEVLKRQIDAAYAKVKKAEYVASNAERILDEARIEWESLCKYYIWNEG